MERELLEAFVFDERDAELVVAPLDRDGAEIELPLLREGADAVGVLGRVTLTLLLLVAEELKEPEDDLVTGDAVLLAAGGTDDRFDPDEETVIPLPWFARPP